MSKRQWESRGSPKQWQDSRRDNSKRHLPNAYAKRDQEGYRRPDQTSRQDAKAQAIQGNVTRGAALLAQLLNEFSNDQTSFQELRSIIGGEAADQVLNLNNLIKPQTQAIKQKLHQVPKIPASDHPVALFPATLPEAFETFVTANPYTIPPLPEIKDANLSQMVFTHRSWFTNNHKKAVTDSYERLEFLGDAYIEVIATRLLYPLYPDLPAGRVSSVREKLVCNETLAAFSLAYDFASQVKVPETYLEEGNSRAKIWTKLLGDIFEAYLAAVIVSDPQDGFNRAELWLRQLWAPRLPDVNVVMDPDKSAKQELQKRLGGVGVRIVYENEKEPVAFPGGREWSIKCSVTGWGFENQFLGRYTGRSKQTAELGAAEEAMDNPLTAQMQAIKAKYDEKVRKERAEASEKDKGQAIKNDTAQAEG